MKILMVSPECCPFAKVGGLGDVLGALPKALVSRGHDVHIFLPLYGSIKPKGRRYDNVVVHLGGHERICSIWEYAQDGVFFYFVEYQQYFGDASVYKDGDQKAERFAFFCRSALDMCTSLDWIPDVIHCHDWTTGLIPVFLNTTERGKLLGKVATVYTIHNLEHQGIFPADILAYAGIPFSEFHANSLESMGYVNFMKGALYHATKLTTVSPHYAQEIQTAAFGCGLDPILKFKAGDLIGILNGIDDKQWNPCTDPNIVANFSAEYLQPKKCCKRDLQRTMGLPESSVPLFGIVSRMYWQKGLDVVLNVLPFVLQNLSLQMVVVGCGEPDWEYRFRCLEAQFPDKLRVFIGYNEPLSHKIEAGSDFFLMPSRFEPCGLNQMYSMRYGTLPIVRATGGLVDTVESLNEKTETGCGFVFYDLTNDAIYNTIGWACSIYYDKPELLAKMQRAGMAKNFSWETAAIQYENVYRWAVQQRSLL